MKFVVMPLLGCICSGGTAECQNAGADELD